MAKSRKPTTPWNGWPLLPCHVPERGKQTIRYYGAYVNSVRGRLRKRQEVDPIPTVLDTQIYSEAFRRNGARLIRKVCETDPLVCPRCQKQMRVAIEHPDAICRILKHLGVCLPVRARTQTGLANRRPEPKAHSPPAASCIDDCFSQLPAFQDDFCQLPPPKWEN
jgi:hypothetical protein